MLPNGLNSFKHWKDGSHIPPMYFKRNNPEQRNNLEWLAYYATYQTLFDTHYGKNFSLPRAPVPKCTLHIRQNVAVICSHVHHNIAISYIYGVTSIYHVHRLHARRLSTLLMAPQNTAPHLLIHKRRFAGPTNTYSKLGCCWPRNVRHHTHSNLCFL